MTTAQAAGASAAVVMLSDQAERRRDPYPWTWEIPAGCVVALLLIGCVGLHAGRACAVAAVGGGWVFPSRADLFFSVPGLLGGDATAGLTSPPAATPPASLLVACMTVVTAVLLAASVAALIAAARRWGPGRMRGMATPAEVHRLLGISRLRRHAPIIRPDLHRRAAR